MFKHDRSVALSLDDATWVAVDGLRYLRPELVLAHKAPHVRDADDGDFAASLPLLDADAVAFLADFVTRTDRAHRWRSRLEVA